MHTCGNAGELKASPLVARLNAQSEGHSFAFIYLTNECQLTCAHCSFQSGPVNTHTRMDGTSLLRALDALKGIGDISITGGEPTLHPDFKKILCKAAQQAKIVYVFTNGINLVGKDNAGVLARHNDLNELKSRLRSALDELPVNVTLFFPLDTFHLKAFRPYAFLLKGLSTLARERQHLHRRPVIGFLSNEVSLKTSHKLMERFSVESCTHVGTALFAPWRKATAVEEWYYKHPLNRTPFAGGVYVNYKGVYLNEASLLLDLREGIETDLKIETLTSAQVGHVQLEGIYRNVSRS